MSIKIKLPGPIKAFEPLACQHKSLGLRIYRITAPNPSAMTAEGTNTYVLRAESQIAVIDPGPDDEVHFRRIMEFADASRPIAKILVTHPHADHSELAVRLAKANGAEIFAHSDSTGAVSESMLPLTAEYDLGGGEGLDMAFRFDRALSDGEGVRVGTARLRAIWTPGHTANHLCYSCDEAKVLFSGDHVMGWSSTMISPPHGNMEEFMASLERLRKRQYQTFLPGHGPPVRNPDALISAQLAHRRLREGQVLSAIGTKPVSSGAVAKKIYSGLSPRLLAAAERNALSHMLDLAARKRIELCGPDQSGSPLFRLNVHKQR